MRRLKYILIISLSLGFLSAGNLLNKELHPKVDSKSFGRGEQLNYKVNYGVLSIGEASMFISNTLHKVNFRDTYKLEVHGRTKGLTGWLVDVDDQWGVYLDTVSLLPHVAYRNLKEGKYRKNEVVRYDHRNKLLEIKVLDQKKGIYKDPEYFYYPINPEGEVQVRDMLGGYLYLRTIDFSRVNVGDTVTVSGFFEDTFYDLQMVLRAREVLRTKAGKFKAMKLTPVVPENKLFNGKDSIVAWFSDDDNKMPLRVEAKMFVGSVFIELSSFSGLKNPPSMLN